MSSKLNKKKKLRPKGYEDRFKIQKYGKDVKLSENCFMEIFYSMQLINIAVLYMSEEDGGFDFTKKKLQNFNRILTRHNTEYDTGGFESTSVSKKHKKNLDFDCFIEAKNFPYRPKMKMFGGKIKSMGEHSIALTSIDVAIETYLILALHTLHENYRFSKDMIWKWWEKFKEVSMLYTEGMTDEFVMKYIKDECGLAITK